MERFDKVEVSCALLLLDNLIPPSFKFHDAGWITAIEFVGRQKTRKFIHKKYPYNFILFRSLFIIKYSNSTFASLNSASNSRTDLLRFIPTDF
jgi:hypothetical protein